MKPFLTFLFLFIACSSFAQNTVSYTLPIPEGWHAERSTFPIDFAPQIRYNGIQDARYAPGCEDTASQDYWTYAFLWCLNGKVKVNVGTIEKNLSAYYTSLVASNIKKRNIPASQQSPTSTSFKKVKTVPGDLKTFTGTVEMLDYISQIPIELYCLVHVKTSADHKHTYIFHEFSLKPYSDKSWQKLDEIWAGFKP